MKSWFKKSWIWILYAILIVMPVFTFYFFWQTNPPTSPLSFWGPYLTYFGTITLGIITFSQTRKVTKMKQRFRLNLKNSFCIYPGPSAYTKDIEKKEVSACLKIDREKYIDAKLSFRLDLSFYNLPKNPPMRRIRMKYVEFYFADDEDTHRKLSVRYKNESKQFKRLSITYFKDGSEEYMISLFLFSCEDHMSEFANNAGEKIWFALGYCLEDINGIKIEQEHVAYCPYINLKGNTNFDNLRTKKYEVV